VSVFRIREACRCSPGDCTILSVRTGLARHPEERTRCRPRDVAWRVFELAAIRDDPESTLNCHPGVGLAPLNEQWFNNAVARPRSISDYRVLTAAAAVIGRAGPGFTLAQVAAEAQVAVGTVAQRFGSKNGLLQALSRVTTLRAMDSMRAVSAAEGSPLDGLRAALVSVYGWLGDAETAANHLGQLGVDIGDPELRALLGEHYAAVETELRRLVRAAASELPGAPEPARAARTLLAVINGVSIDWSIRPNGPLVDRLEQDIDAVLVGWRRERE
jgi:AcrR family transcriptional regulator